MPVALETDRPVKSSKIRRFWQRQFELRSTLSQTTFDVILGAILPLICLIIDPGILRGGGLPAPQFLVRLAFSIYLVVGICIAALLLYLVTRRASFALAGVLCAGAIFSASIGILIFPLTLLGMLMLIGFLGLTPFFTAFVFLRNARRCWLQAAQKGSASLLPVAVLAATFTLLVPTFIQFQTSKVADNALFKLQMGSDQDADRAIHTLKLIRFAFDTDRLVFAYQNATETKQRERLARAFHEVTGQNIEARLADLND